MNNKKTLTRTELADVKAGGDENSVFIPAPPPGYKYCSYMMTCPNFDYRVCIFPINDVDPDSGSAKSCIG
jgi:hypothetical protein